MNDARGSLWRRWDLHVHTPASLYHNYGSDNDLWERFITALEQLPADFSVIGINDYLFLDGYRKVIEFKTRGRLQNIDAFLPVLEFRLALFAGTEGKLRRINYHVVFSNEVTSDQIEQQFLNQLKAHYTLSPRNRRGLGRRCYPSESRGPWQGNHRQCSGPQEARLRPTGTRRVS